MKLTATREDILSPLQSVIGVVERRQTMPVLANVLLSARENSLSITGTDLEVELVADELRERGGIRGHHCARDGSSSTFSRHCPRRRALR